MNYKDYETKIKNILINNDLENDNINNIVNSDNFIIFLDKIKKKFDYIKLYNFSSKEYFYKYENDLLLFNILELICKKKLKDELFNNYIFDYYELTYYIIDNRIQLLNAILTEYYDICVNYYNLSRKYKKDFSNYKINIKKKLIFLKEKKKDLLMKNNIHFIYNKFYKNQLAIINNNNFNFENINIDIKFSLSIDFYDKFNVKDNILIKYIIELLYKNKIENLHLLFKYIKYFVYNYDYINIENKLTEILIQYYIKIEHNNSLYDYEKINMKKILIYFYNIILGTDNVNINEDLLVNLTYIILTDLSYNILECTKIEKELENEKNGNNNQVEINILIKEKNYYLILIDKFSNVIKKTDTKLLFKKEIINKFILVFNDLLNLMTIVEGTNKLKINDILKLYYKLYLENINYFLKNIINDERYTNNINFFQNIHNNFVLNENTEILNIIIKSIEEKSNKKIDIPEKYCDPLYFTIINNPIELPGNLIIMDEQIIKECLLLKNENPFDRSTLTLEILEKHNNTDEVKKRINIFKNELQLWKNTNNIN